MCLRQNVSVSLVPFLTFFTIDGFSSVNRTPVHIASHVMLSDVRHATLNKLCFCQYKAGDVSTF